jgi:hypothetical protein
MGAPMSRTPTKPQCPAAVSGIDTAGNSGTFFCQLRDGHRGAHKYDDTMARQTGDVPAESFAGHRKLGTV